MMDSEMINLSTGPVQITAGVKTALATSPIAHRSVDFSILYKETSDLLRREYQAKHCFLLTGSGTLANEVMLHQLRSKGKGLIISNGEFGERLIDQATRISLEFIDYREEWGEALDLVLVENLVANSNIAWIAFTHCETSTGVVNDLEKITAIAKKQNCECYADCMSTIGTHSFDLSTVTMATASSGKGLASIPGIALVFSNIEPVPDPALPSYLDLGQYYLKSGVPFTISSNLISALHASIRQKLSVQQYLLTARYRDIISDLLRSANLVPYCHRISFVFTLTPGEGYHDMLDEFRENNLVVSYESEYLRKRKWIQLALFNYYSKAELEDVVNRLSGIVQNKKVKSQKQLTHF